MQSESIANIRSVRRKQLTAIEAVSGNLARIAPVLVTCRELEAGNAGETQPCGISEVARIGFCYFLPSAANAEYVTSGGAQ